MPRVAPKFPIFSVNGLPQPLVWEPSVGDLFTDPAERARVGKQAVRYIQALPKGILSGAHHWVENTWEALSHPYDEVIVPIGKFIFDASILTDEQNPFYFQRYGEMPQYYQDAQQRMDERWGVLGGVCTAVGKAEGPEQIEMAASLLTEVLLNKRVIHHIPGVAGRFEGVVTKFKSLEDIAAELGSIVHHTEMALEFTEARTIMNPQVHLAGDHHDDHSTHSKEPGFMEKAADYALAIPRAIYTGANRWVANTTEALMHPIDRIFLPALRFRIDAEIIGNHRNMLFYPVNGQYPKYHQDATQRMSERFEVIKEMGTAVANATGPERFELGLSLLTELALNRLAIGAGKGVVNQYRLGAPRPPSFHNLVPQDVIPSLHVNKVSISDVRAAPHEIYNYVITHEGKVLLTQALPSQGGPRIIHPQLASGVPVHAAGQVMVKYGMIEKINDISGHYRPFGEHLPNLVTRAFQRAGFYEVEPTIFVPFKSNSQVLGISGQTFIPGQNMTVRPFMGGLSNGEIIRDVLLGARAATQRITNTSEPTPLSLVANVLESIILPSAEAARPPVLLDTAPAPSASANFRTTVETLRQATEFSDLRDAIAVVPRATLLSLSVPEMTANLAAKIFGTANLSVMTEARQEAAAPSLLREIIDAAAIIQTINPAAIQAPAPAPTPSLTATHHAMQASQAFVVNNLYSSFVSPFERAGYSWENSSSFSTLPSLDFRTNTEKLLGRLSFMDLHTDNFNLRWALREDPFLHLYVPSSGLNAIRESVVRDVMHSQMFSLLPDANSAFFSASSMLGSLGLGSYLSTCDFYSIVRSSGLGTSYASFNPFADIERVHDFLCKISGREPGGVAQQVGILEDLINSPVHDADDFTLCFPTKDGKLPFTNEQLRQVAREVAVGFFGHKTAPFFSLDFSKQGFLVPQIHPAYTNTLTGKVISILDYYLKCLLNGGTFDQAFIEDWFKTMNMDEAYLKSHLIDLKTYCKSHGLPYSSLREMMKRAGVDESANSTSSAYKQPFMTSFRIIAKTKKVERAGSTLLIEPDFDIKYSIDLMPDYESYINQYHREHGRYPEDFEKTKICYEQFAVQLKGYLLKLPMTRDLMNMLGVINFYCYFYSTMQAMGKMPKLPPEPVVEQYKTPAAFPPLPVRYYQMHPLNITFGELISKLHADEEANATLVKIDDELKPLFAIDEILEIPESIKARIRAAVIELIITKLKIVLPEIDANSVNEAEVDRYVNAMEAQLISGIEQTREAFASRINIILPAFEAVVGPCPVPIELANIKEIFGHLKEATRQRFELVPAIARRELIQLLPRKLRTQANSVFERIEIGHQQAYAAAITEYRGMEAENEERLIAEIQAHFVEVRAKALLENESGAVEVIAKQLAQMEADINKQMSEAIAEIEGFRQKQLAQVPADLSRLTPESRASIEQFKRDMDNEIVQIRTRAETAKTEISSGIRASIEEQKAALMAKNAEILNQAEAEGIRRFREDHAQKIERNLNDGATKNASEILSDIKSAAIEIYKNYIEQHEGFLLSCIETMTKNLLKISRVAERSIGRETKYCHSVTSFDSNEFTKDGLKIKINGGCGVSISNMSTKPMVNGNAFTTALSGIEVLPETWSLKDYAGTQYAVSKMPVRDATISTVADYQELGTCITAEGDSTAEERERIKATINALGSDENTILSLTPEDLHNALDPSGAKAIHYGALMLGKQSFEKLVVLDRRQLRLTDHMGHLAIHAAVVSGNLKAIEFILSEDSSLVNGLTYKGLNPLILAIQHGRLNVAEFLLNRGADANHQLPNELFALYIAIQNNFSGLANLLLDKVPNLKVDFVLGNGMTALHLALEYRMFDVALKIIERGADLLEHRKSDGLTPFHIAAWVNNQDLVALMISRGVPVDSVLDSGKTALHIAAERGHVDLVKTLLTRGANASTKNIDGDSPLMLAIKEGHLNVAIELAAITDINLINQRNQTASLLAAEQSMWPVVDCLLERGENHEFRDIHGINCTYQMVQQGESARFGMLLDEGKIDKRQIFAGNSLSAIAARLGHMGILSQLIACNATFASTYTDNPKYYFPVMAVQNDEVAAFRLWLATPTEIREFDSIIPEGPYKGQSLAYLAAERSSLKCLSVLRRTLTDDDIVEQKVLIAAIQSRKLAAVKLCMIREPERDLDAYGNNALHHAVICGSRDILEELVRNGLKTNKANKRGHTAFHLALINNDIYLLKRLLKLTPKDDWPDNLHTVIDGKTADALITLLKTKGYKLLKPEIRQDEKETRLEKERQLAMPKIDNFLAIARRVTNLLKTHNFQGLLKLVRRYPELVHAYRLDNQTLLGAALDSAQPFSDDDDEDQVDFAKLLLSELKIKGADPENYVGKHNPLLTLIKSGADKEEIQYRLSLLSEIYPEALAALVLDQVMPELTVAQLALKAQHTVLFTELLKYNPKDYASVDYIPLHEAIDGNRYDLAASLVNDVNVNSTNRQLQTPLMLAAKKGNVRLMQCLLDNGACPDKVDIHGRNVLHYALMTESTSAALFLMPIVRDKNRADRYGVTILMRAAFKGNVPIINAICSGEDYTNQVDARGRTALHMAALEGKTTAIEALVAHGFRLDQIENPTATTKANKSERRTPLHYAAFCGKAPAVLKLLELGSDPLQQDRRGQTVFEYALISKNKELWRVLRKLVEERYSSHKPSLLLAAASCDHVDALIEIMAEGIDTNTTDSFGNSALHLSAANNSINVTKLLAERSELINYTNREGRTALHLAAERGNVGPIKALIAAEAELNQRDSMSLTPLYLACRNGNLAAVMLLIKNSAIQTLSDSQGATPAQIALINGHVEIARFLAKGGDTSFLPIKIASLPALTQTKIKMQSTGLAECQGLALAFVRGLRATSLRAPGADGLFGRTPISVDDVVTGINMGVRA